MRISIETTLPEASRRMAGLAKAVEIGEQRATGMAAALVHRAAGQHFIPYGGTQRASLASMGLVRTRSGHLKQSLGSSAPQRDARGWYATVGFRKGTVNAYAATVEEGRVFSPNRAKVLAIPVGKALTGAGVARYRSPWDVADGFWSMRAGGFLGFFQAVGKRLELLFVGKKSVEVKEFKPLRRSLESQRPKFAGIYEQEIGRSIAAALRG